MTDDSASVADEVESNPNSHTYITIFIVLTIKKKEIKICRAQTRSCAGKEKRGGWGDRGSYANLKHFSFWFLPEEGQNVS